MRRSELLRLLQRRFGMLASSRSHCAGIEEVLGYQLEVLGSHCFVLVEGRESAPSSESSGCEFED